MLCFEITNSKTQISNKFQKSNSNFEIGAYLDFVIWCLGFKQFISSN